MKSIVTWIRAASGRSALFGGLLVLDPKGDIALQQRDLLFLATWLMLLVVIPVLVMTAVIAYRYRAHNTKAIYKPDWAHSAVDEFIWWAIPSIIIGILAVVTWTSSHQLDPYRPLQSDRRPLVIQVVALNWKWLFIYPEQGIASVNHVQFPVHTPIDFRITADAPMNSFWIPQLGGQIYAMSGMQTRLHLIARDQGDYRGVSANFSGPGFSGMKFTARASSEAAFESWVAEVKASSEVLSGEVYREIAQPSVSDPVQYFSSVENGLHAAIMDAYMKPPDGLRTHGMSHE